MRSRLLVSALLTALLSTAAALPVTAAELTDGGEYIRTPMVVTVSDDRDATIRDENGVVIPATGTDAPGDGLLRIPSLTPGVYILDDAGEQRRFTVEADVFMGNEGMARIQTAPQGESAPTTLLLGALATAALLGVVILRRRRIAVAVVVVLATGVGVFLTSATTGNEPPAMASCVQISSDEGAAHRCMLTRLVFLLDRDGGDATAAIAELGTGAVIRGCHEVAHEFGRLSWIAGGYDAVAVPGREVCEQGFYHGAMEAASIYLDDAQFTDAVVGYCSDVLPRAEEYLLINCSHGLGHGLMRRFAGDLDKASAVCAQLRNVNERLRSECVGAAYMEHARLWAAASGDPAYQPTPAVATAGLCRDLDVDVAVHCYNAVAMSTQPVWGESLSQLVEFCRSEPGDDTGARLACVDGIMRESMYHSKNAPDTGKICAEFSTPGEQRVCLARVAQRLVAQKVVTEAVAACREAGAVDLSPCVDFGPILRDSTGEMIRNLGDLRTLASPFPST